MNEFFAPAQVWDHPKKGTFPNNQEEAFMHSAWLRGCEVERLNKAVYFVDSGEQRLGFSLRMSQATSLVGRVTANNKDLSRKLLSRAGLRVAEGAEFQSTDMGAGWAFAEQIGMLVVTKPLAGYGGKGVTLSINSKEQFKRGWAAAAEYGDRVVVEKMHRGMADYRVLVIDNHVVAAMRRWPASVVGDGVRTIRELIEQKGEVRKKVPYISSRPFGLEDSMRHFLADKGLPLSYVPQAKERVQLHEIANISAGGDGEDVTDLMHPGFCEAAVRARRAFPGLFQAGVDLLAHDISRPPDEQDWIICEVNANPDTSLHHFPVIGPSRDVHGALVEALFPEVRSRQVETETRVLVIHGEVQNVGFRGWLRKAAIVHAVDCWARNTHVGTLEAVFKGPVKAVAALCRLCESGPPRAKVRKVYTRGVPEAESKALSASDLGPVLLG